LPLIPVIAGDVALFTLWHSYPVLREIFIREQIDIVHGH
jgi:hypothetical protein